MRQVLIPLAFLALAANAHAGPGFPVDVYIMAGQSNAVGQGSVANLPTGVSADPRVWLYHSASLKSSAQQNAWAPLRPASDNPLKFGPEVSFGNRMQVLTNNRPVAIIKHAINSSDLLHAWAPGKDNADRAHFGPQYAALAITVETALKSLRDKGFEPTIRGLLWQQGEHDAIAEDSALSYAANLSHLITRLRDQFHAPDMVFVYGFVLSPPSNLPFRETIRTAQGAIDQDSGSPFAVKNAFVVFTDDLGHLATDVNTPDPKDHIHLGTTGVWELGRRMAETMANKGKMGR